MKLIQGLNDEIINMQMQGSYEDLDTGLNTAKAKATLFLSDLFGLLMPFSDPPVIYVPKSMGACMSQFYGFSQNTRTT